MYTDNDMIYADAGKVLRSAGLVALSMPVGTEAAEIDAPAADMHLSDDGMVALWGNDMMACRIIDGADYAHYKTLLIKRRYSNDDQIAVMLNGDTTEMDRMQAWRSWAAATALHIMHTIGNSK